MPKTVGAPIKTGLIGLGNSGWFYHAEGSLSRSSQFDLVAVCSRSPSHVQRAAARFAAIAYTDWEALLRDDRVELVVIATPHDLHHRMAVDALRAGKHVVVEKPMAMSTAEADEMIAVAEEEARVLTVFHNRRWEPSYQIIKQIVAAGTIGPVWRAEERRMHSGKYKVAADNEPHLGVALAEWAHQPRSGGGVTYLVAPHLIDHQLNLFGAQPLTVSAVTDVYPGDTVEHYIDLHMTFTGNILSRIEIFRENVVDLPKWSVFGIEGTLVAPTFHAVELRVAGHETQIWPNLPNLRTCAEFYEGLYRAIRQNAPPPVDPMGARNVIRVIEAALGSARAGGKVIDLTAVDHEV